MGIFSGLENLGLGKMKGVDIYQADNEKKSGTGDKKEEKHEVSEAEILFEKGYKCPVCDHEFKVKTIRTGKVKLLSADTDLRPRYQGIDSLKYDAIVCPMCGYGALNRFFNYMTSAQAKLIKEQISCNFKGLPAEGEIYSYDDAILRHKIALANTVVKKAKTSERAYTCLKLAWILRGKAETLPADEPNREAVLKELQDEEAECIQNAFEGFKQAFSKENFPMCGMDEVTTTYLAAELARRCGCYDEAGRWVAQILTSRTASERIKSKAREIKDLIREDKHGDGE